jgi:septum site-determining protein MinC
VSNAGQAAQRDVPFQLRGNSFTMMVLKVNDPASPEFFPQLNIKVRQAPNFFRNAPVVIDFDELPEEAAGFDMAAFIQQVRAHHLLPMGFQGGPRPVQDAALAAGLTPMPAGRATRLEEAKAPDPRGGAAVAPPEPAYRPTLVVTEPVRSGQQIYAEKSDLVITTSVSPGAEVLADGHIHIYGALRGRALAGVSGETSARIYCQSLEAEVVSVAGLYRVSEDIAEDMRKKPVQVFLRDGYLHMSPL